MREREEERKRVRVTWLGVQVWLATAFISSPQPPSSLSPSSLLEAEEEGVEEERTGG